MLLLILTVCSLSPSDQCRETRLQFTDVGFVQCMTTAQPIVAQWADEHPNLRVARWRCALPEHEGSPT